MIAHSKSADDLQPGDVMPVVEKTFSSVDLVMYAGATWDWHRLHHDDAFAHDMGLPAPVIDGQVYGAYFAKHAIQWLGPKCFIRRLKFRMRAMAFGGDTLALEGRVIEILDGNVAALEQRIMRGKDIIAEAATEIRLDD